MDTLYAFDPSNIITKQSHVLLLLFRPTKLATLPIKPAPPSMYLSLVFLLFWPVKQGYETKTVQHPCFSALPSPELYLSNPLEYLLFSVLNTFHYLSSPTCISVLPQVSSPKFHPTTIRNLHPSNIYLNSSQSFLNNLHDIEIVFGLPVCLENARQQFRWRVFWPLKSRFCLENARQQFRWRAFWPLKSFWGCLFASKTRVNNFVDARFGH